jgi:HK97 family phage major capsid protein
MPVTLEDIEKGLGQIKSNMATKTEVAELIDKKLDEDREKAKAEKEKSDKLFETAQKTIEELKKANDAVVAQVKMLHSTRFAPLKTSSGMYNGVWGDLETAKNFGTFILAEVFGNKKAAEYLGAIGIERKSITAAKALGEDVDTTGGILVPSEFIPHLIMLIEKYGVFRRNVLEWPMAGAEAIAPKLSSGLAVYCVGAGVEPSPSDPGFRAVGMQAKKWMTLTAIDSELDEDSAIAVGEAVGFLIAQAFAQQEDKVGFLGDGTETYFGHVGITGALRAVDATIGNIKSLVVASGNAYSEIVLTDFEKQIGVLPDFADNGDAKWYAHRYFYYTVMVKLALAAGGTSATEIIAGRGVREKTFLSYPVEFAQVMPRTEANDQQCAIFGNLRLGAYMGDRRKLTIDRSSEAYFKTDQIGIRGTERVAPTVHGVGDTTNAGPITALITAGS